MAEVLGTVASVIQVAEVGFSLATTLYNYATTVKGAEKDIKRIARDVKLTSKVLESTHKQLQQDKQANLYTQDALFDLGEVLEGCKEAFKDVDDALRKSLKPGPNGKLSVSTFDKLKWPLRSGKLDLLRANLEKLKTTLLLMLSVLTYGSKIAQNATTPNVSVALTVDHLQIQNLVEAKDTATQRYEELSAAFARLEMKIDQNVQNVMNTSTFNGFDNITMMAVPNLSAAPPLMPAWTSPYNGEINSRLQLCAEAVSMLAQTIEVATGVWQTTGLLQHNECMMAYHNVGQNLDALTTSDLLSHPPDSRGAVINPSSHTVQRSTYSNVAESGPPRKRVLTPTQSMSVERHRLMSSSLKPTSKDAGSFLEVIEEESHINPSAIVDSGEDEGELFPEETPSISDHLKLILPASPPIPVAWSNAISSSKQAAFDGVGSSVVVKEEKKPIHPSPIADSGENPEEMTPYGSEMHILQLFDDITSDPEILHQLQSTSTLRNARNASVPSSSPPLSQDYQEQLQLLESQNKKRLLMAQQEVDDEDVVARSKKSKSKKSKTDGPPIKPRNGRPGGYNEVERTERPVSSVGERNIRLSEQPVDQTMRRPSRPYEPQSAVATLRDVKASTSQGSTQVHAPTYPELPFDIDTIEFGATSRSDALDNFDFDSSIAPEAIQREPPALFNDSDAQKWDAPDSWATYKPPSNPPSPGESVPRGSAPKLSDEKGKVWSHREADTGPSAGGDGKVIEDWKGYEHKVWVRCQDEDEDESDEQDVVGDDDNDEQDVVGELLRRWVKVAI